MAKTIRDLESLYEDGENPNGLTAQTANGTAHWRGTGWNWTGPWGATPQLPEDATRPGGRSNRTGE